MKITKLFFLKKMLICFLPNLHFCLLKATEIRWTKASKKACVDTY
jgi:hypothetical protein